MQRYQPPHLPRPTTLRGWIQLARHAMAWTWTSAHLPEPGPRRRYARNTLLMAAVLVTAPSIATVTVIYLITR
jgi:hypothetical protein